MTTNANWKWLQDETHIWKAHVVSANLIPDLELELLERAETEAKEQGTPIFTTLSVKDNVVGLDLPGMIMKDRSIRTVDIDGLTLEMPSQDWESLLAEVKLLQKRVFASGLGYYKIHAHFYCLVLTPEQRNIMIKAMEAQLAEAAVEGEADDKRFADGLRKLNEELAEKGGAQIISARALAYDQAQVDQKGRN